jgi:hypothetical protein
LGIYYTSYAGLGVMIDARGPAFKTEVVIPSCEHPERQGHRFCPECGTKVQDRRSTESTDLLETLLYLVNKEIEMPDGYMAAELGYEDKFFVGFCATSERDTLWAGVREPPSYDEIKATLKKILEPLGLYDSSTFGLYSLTIGY